MVTFLKIFIVVVLTLALIGWLADRRAAANKPHVTPGLSFLPGDIKYESPNGNVRSYRDVDRPLSFAYPDPAFLQLRWRCRSEAGHCSALGHERTSHYVRLMSALPPKPDIAWRNHVSGEARII